jgi:hypothetical protein
MEIRKIALIGVIAVAAALLGWACSDNGGNELSLEEYFEQLDDAENKFTDDSDASFENVPDEPEISEVQDALREFTNVLQDFVGDLEDLNPPEQAQAAHDDAIDAAEEVIDVYENLIDEADDLETVDELFESTQGEAATEALDRLTTACLDLQDVANENELDFDLNCNDDE